MKSTEKNTEIFYEYAAQYQQKRKRVIDEHESRVKYLERYRGGKHYAEDLKKLNEKKDEEINALKDDYMLKIGKVLKDMTENNEKRGINPPSDENMRIVKTLKMRDKLTVQELDRAANSLKGDDLSLSILTELARKNGIVRNYQRDYGGYDMPVSDVAETIDGIRVNLRDFMDYDTTYASRAARAHHDELYGADPNPAPLPKRPLFENKYECFEQLAGLSDNNFNRFSAAVNGNEE